MMGGGRVEHGGGDDADDDADDDDDECDDCGYYDTSNSICHRGVYVLPLTHRAVVT